MHSRFPDDPAHDLSTWSGYDWADGIEMARCAPLDRFEVSTCNSTYEITVLEPATGEVMVRGGRLFPGWERAFLAGCSLGGAFLKLRAIYPGFLMELLAGGQSIVTTRVQSITPLPASVQ